MHLSFTFTLFQLPNVARSRISIENSIINLVKFKCDDYGVTEYKQTQFGVKFLINSEL